MNSTGTTTTVGLSFRQRPNSRLSPSLLPTSAPMEQRALNTSASAVDSLPAESSYKTGSVGAAIASPTTNYARTGEPAPLRSCLISPMFSVRPFWRQSSHQRYCLRAGPYRHSLHLTKRPFLQPVLQMHLRTRNRSLLHRLFGKSIHPAAKWR